MNASILPIHELAKGWIVLLVEGFASTGHSGEQMAIVGECGKVG